MNLSTPEKMHELGMDSKPMNQIKGARFYRPELDMLRFFAFICVFVHHLRKQSYDAVNENIGTATRSVPSTAHSIFTILWKAFHFSLESGVNLFFFLSAYLITTLLVMEIERTGTIHIGAFYVRRALRIWPLYFTYLVITIGVGWMVPAGQMHLSEALSYAFFVGNWYCVQHAPWRTVVFVGILWSISIEEQFYLFCPLTVLLFKRVGLTLLSVLALVTSFGILYWFGSHGYFNDAFLRPNTFIQLMFLAGGTLTALMLRGRTVNIRAKIRPILVIAGMGVWCYAYLQFEESSPLFILSAFAPLLNYFFVLVGVLLIFFGFLGLESRWVSSWLVYLGQISYGLYIWHMIVLWFITKTFGVLGAAGSFAKCIAALGITMLLASASYRWLETPFLLLKDRFAFIKTRSHKAIKAL